MQTRCVDRPDRSNPRPFTTTKVAKLLCELVRRGTTRAEFEKEYERVCPDAPKRRGTAAEEALAVAAEALEQNNVMIDADAQALQRFLAFFSLIAVAFRYVGRYVGAPGKVISIGVIAAEAAAKERLAVITIQKAANDSALAIVRRAAANAPEFAVRVGAR